MKLNFVTLISALLLVIGIFGDPQYGGYEDSISPDNSLAQPTDWVLEIQDLIEIMRQTFAKMSIIALQDYPDAGLKIGCILNCQLRKAIQIADEFYASVGYTGNGRIRRNHQEIPIHMTQLVAPDGIDEFYNQFYNTPHRFRRQAGDKGEETYNKVGDILSQAGGQVDGEKARLSPGAQADMDKEYVEGLRQCKSRECKSQLKVYESGKQG